MPSEHIPAQPFQYNKKRSNKSKDVVPLCHSDLLKAAVQFIRHGGENNLHSHTYRDGFFFVLAGRIRVYTTDDELIADLGPKEGILIPRGFPYWFESSGGEELELLQVAAADLRRTDGITVRDRTDNAPALRGRAEEREITENDRTST